MAKILIIDDDPDIVDSLTMVLEANDFTVSSRADTDNLIAEVMAANPDLIILDVIFPEDPQAGFNAARELSKNEKLSHIPVLILSAVNEQSDMSFGFPESDISEDFMPVQGFIEKPFTCETLMESLAYTIMKRDMKLQKHFE